MSFTFITMYHQTDDTPFEDRYQALIEGPNEKEQEYNEYLLVGRPQLFDFVQNGLAEGWLKIIEEYKRPDQS